MQEGSSAVSAALWGCWGTSVSWAGAVQEHQELEPAAAGGAWAHSGFMDKLVTKWWRWSKVQRLPACSLLPQDKAWCDCHGATEILGAFPPLTRHCVAWGRLQSLWLCALIQSGKFCLLPSAGCSVPVVCEHWQNLLAGKGGDLESSRSLFFPSIAMQSHKWWFHRRFAHNLVYGSQIGFYRA